MSSQNGTTINAVTMIEWAPYFPAPVIAGIAIAATVVFILAAFKKPKGFVLRAGLAVLLILALLNPTLLEEKQEPVRDVAFIVSDGSQSQDFENRKQRSENALSAISETLQDFENLEVRVVEKNRAEGSNEDDTDKTLLFKNLESALRDVPASRRAGVVMITDGQVHDAPQNAENMNNYGPVHVLLSGKKDEKDRELVIKKVPSYGIVGQNVTVALRIQDNPDSRPETITELKISGADGKTQYRSVRTGQSVSVDLPIEHAGQNVFEIEAEPIDGEITEVNNKTAILVNGVRDRLRVLLVSGMPHAGERTWRNILTADPAVDLVHFTILRQPHKLNTVPQEELSLIPFPFQELFEVKLYDFDLIIFDRYKMNNIMPPYYFNNIARYVREGGALLEASGPAFASDQSIFFSDLETVLPSVPTGDVIRKPFLPALTALGNRHPVTIDLKSNTLDGQWGRWLQQVGVTVKSGDIVMEGADGIPLLTLDRVEEGRVAHLTSDLIWLWSRGYDGGGPQAELLRRLAHWLMKEPELEENALDVTVDGNTITLRRRSLDPGTHIVKMTGPDGETRQLTLEGQESGWVETRIEAEKLGIYRFEEDDMKRIALVGNYNPPELQRVITTEDRLKTVVNAGGGSFHWLSENPGVPPVRMVPASRSNYAGAGWIGLRQNNDYIVNGVQSRSLFPDLPLMLLLSLILLGTWIYESRVKG